MAGVCEPDTPPRRSKSSRSLLAVGIEENLRQDSTHIELAPIRFEFLQLLGQLFILGKQLLNLN